MVGGQVSAAIQSAERSEGATTGGDEAGDHGAGAKRRSRAISTPMRWAIVVIVALVVLLLVVVLGQPRTSDVRYAPNNPDPNGARAAAEVLGRQGVEVSYVRSTAAALADARPDGTVLIVDPDALRDEQLQALAELPGDVVILGTSRRIGELTPAISYTSDGARDLRQAGCADPHASAATEVLAPGPLVLAEGDDVEVCFELAGEAGGLYASWAQGSQQWRALPNPDLITNDLLAEHGHAALIFRALGQHDHLTWYLPSPNDRFGIDEQDSGPVNPLLSGPMLVLYLLLAAAMIAWRGRRLGPLVVENLPVVVKASETTRGRGRLYRRNEAFAHAGSALRAGAVARISGRLGLARWAQRDDVVQAIARATGRHPEQVDAVLYSPPPHDDASLIALTEALDTIESEVDQQ